MGRRRMEQGLLCLGWCLGCAQLAQGSPWSLSSLPFCTVGPAAISGPSDQPQSPPFPQALAYVPLLRWTVSPALKPPLAAPMAGGRGIGLGTCRSSVCPRSIPWTLVTTSPHFIGRHSTHAARRASLSGRAGAARAEPWQVAEREERPALVPSLAGWDEGAGQGPAQQGHPVPFTQASLVGRRH